MQKFRPNLLLCTFPAFAVACGTGGLGDAPPPSLPVSHHAVRTAPSAHSTIDFPGATFTEVNDINDNGDVVGRYILGDSISHGFLRDSEGVFTTIDVPGAIFTTPKGINRDGDIVGGYIAADGLTHGFLLSDGDFTQIDFSDTTATFPTGIDSEGDIVGGYCNRPCSVFDVNARGLHGFFITNDKFVTFDVPGSTSTALIHTSRRGGFVGLYKDAKDVPHGFVLNNGALGFIDVPGAVGTWALGINASGDVVGSWCDANPCSLAQSHNHAFRLGEHGIEVFDAPGAATSRAWAINDHGDIAGASRDSQGANHGFVIVKGDEEHVAFTTIDVPAALGTIAADIGPEGKVLGRYCLEPSCIQDITGNWRGFELSDGDFTSIDFPRAFHTSATGTNARGDIVGRYRDVVGGPFHGFLLNENQFTTIDVPGAFSTRAYGLAPGGEIIVGDYCTTLGCIRPAAGSWHGFVLRGGEFTSFDVPFPGARFTQVWRINSAEQIVGRYLGADNKFHVFVRTDDSYISIDYPDLSAKGTGNDAGGINDNGDIVSSWVDGLGKSHGFLLRRGQFTSFDFPGATFTNAHAINNQREIVGIYMDTSGMVHGFVRK